MRGTWRVSDGIDIQNVRVKWACPGNTRCNSGSRAARNVGSTAMPAPAAVAWCCAKMLVLRSAKLSGRCNSFR